MKERILIKLSGEALMGNSGYGIDVSTINFISKEIKKIAALDYEICLIIGGGNIFRGVKGASEGIDRSTSDYMGMLATIMNALSLQSCLEQIDIPTRVQSAISMSQIAEPYIKNKASNHLDKNRVVIFASGTGNTFFSTDTADVLRASEMKSDVILKGTKVDGIYDKDPVNNSDAIKIPEISYSDYLNKDIKVMDATAISLAKDRSLPIIIFSILKSSNILDIVSGNGSFSIIKDS